MIAYNLTNKVYSLAFLLLINYGPINNISSYKLIQEICIINFNKEMKAAGIIPSRKLAIKTCDCFIKRISTGQSISNAKKHCKDSIKISLSYYQTISQLN